MRDVTDLIMRFRETCRHLWNAELREGADWDVRDDFDEMCSILFRAMVLRGIGSPQSTLPPGSEVRPLPLPFLRVVPSSLSPGGTPILINRTSPPAGYWDHPVGSVKAEDVVLRFVRFFDFGDLGYRDFEYVWVSIEAFPRHAELVRRPALLKAEHARVFFEEAGNSPE